MARCDRPGCGHLRRRHGAPNHTGACQIKPSGHCESFVAPVVEPPSSLCDGVAVTGSIQQAIDANPAGTTLCLAGTYEIGATLLPKSGQRLIGPATLVAKGAVPVGIDLKGAKAKDVQLVDLDVSGFTQNGLLLWMGVHVLRGRYHHNLTNGLGGGFEYSQGTVTLDGVEVDNNGSEAQLGVSSGGVKIARLADVFLATGCHIHDNIGNGIWADVQCIGSYRVENNMVIHNSRKGIHYEKSGASDEFKSYGVVCKGCGLPVVEGSAHISGNTVSDNGWEGREHSDFGIGVVSSRNVTIENNTTSGNHRAGICLTQDDRLSGEQHGWLVEAVVRGNTTPDGKIGCDLPGVTCD